jgi:hypothetical protein
MILTESSSRPVLVNRTNLIHESHSTPSEHGEAKRPSSGSEGAPNKRVKPNPKDDKLKESSCNHKHSSDVDITDRPGVMARQRKNTMFYMMNVAAMSRPRVLRQSCALTFHSLPFV